MVNLYGSLVMRLLLVVNGICGVIAANEGFCPLGSGNAKPSCENPQHQQQQQQTRAIISKPAPQFSGNAIINKKIEKISLSDYKGKYVVLLFYPLDFTFVCPTEILAFSDRLEEFRQINADVIACSVDSHFSHLAWVNTPRCEGGLGNVKIPLLSDLTHEIGKSYGVYINELGHTLRGLFIIDQQGVLRQITMNDLPVGRSVDETLRLIQAFQYTDTHDEVCPAGWKPGGDTIIPAKKNDYFKKHFE